MEVLTLPIRKTSAEPRAKLSRRGLCWALEGIVRQHLTVARVAEGLGVAWNTANDAVLAEGKRVLIDDPHRLDGVQVLGVDEHVWRHTRRGDKYVTVIIDLTPIRDGTGPARLLDMVEGRSKQAFKQWLSGRPEAWRDGVEVVAMDGFTGFKTAAAEEIPAAVAVMEVEATWGIYQRMIAAYRHPDRTKGRELMQNLIGSVSAGVPAALSEVITAASGRCYTLDCEEPLILLVSGVPHRSDYG